MMKMSSLQHKCLSVIYNFHVLMLIYDPWLIKIIFNWLHEAVIFILFRGYEASVNNWYTYNIEWEND